MPSFTSPSQALLLATLVTAALHLFTLSRAELTGRSPVEDAESSARPAVVIRTSFVTGSKPFGQLPVDTARASPTAYARLTKPLPLLLLIALTFVVPAPLCSPPQCWILRGGLLLSLAGDICLMWPQGFLPGLASFLLAHVCYVVACSWGIAWAPAQLLLLLPFLVYGVAMLGYLWPHLGRYRGPVVAYMLAIVAMGWRAAVRHPLPAGAYWLGLAGACLFLASDSLLAVDRFVRPLRHGRMAVMATYYAAQVGIVLSFGFGLSG